ncbi:MAG: RAMP superfamily CRISPR-associated protein [Candidatus Bipolaricaulaceae bacterium]
MQRDYYAFKQAELSDSLNELDQAAQAFEEAKRRRDRKARDQAERQMKQAAEKAVRIEPHLAYLWFEARASELDNSIRDAWQERLTAGAIPQAFHFTPDSSVITYLPPLSFILHIPFQLYKPYLSKDDRDFHLLDNPVRKEKVFQKPMVASTCWKGALRAAFWQLGYKEDHETTIRLLGNPRESDEQQAGRLYFFPSFFKKVGLEVINPHDRKTGVGARGPILMECVRQGTKGELLLLYVPFGPIEKDERERQAEVAQDLEVLAQGVPAMLTTYGFGAKTSSGFGVVEDRLAGEGKLAVRVELAGETATSAAPLESQQPDLPCYLESPTRLRPDLRRPDGSLKSEAEYQALIESRGQKYGKKNKQLYAKAKSWWEREGRAMAEAATQEPGPKPEPAPSQTPPVSEFTFHTLSELCDLAQEVGEQLRKRGEA